MTFRSVRVFAVIWGLAGAALLLSDVLVRDQALALAALGVLASSAVLGILAMPSIETQNEGAWAKVAWGRFFVAIIYASLTVACFAAIAHTPDAARLLHALHGAF